VALCRRPQDLHDLIAEEFPSAKTVSRMGGDAGDFRR
jgi:hypothetical protein